MPLPIKAEIHDGFCFNASVGGFIACPDGPVHLVAPLSRESVSTV